MFKKGIIWNKKGVNKVYLYNVGDENNALTGGWSARRYSGSYTTPTLTKNAGDMVLSGTYPQTGFAYAVNAIDLTNYTKLCYEVANVISSNGVQKAYASVINAAVDSPTFYLNSGFTITTTTTIYEYDISALNVTGIVSFYEDSSGPGITASTKILRIWLE